MNIGVPYDRLMEIITKNISGEFFLSTQNKLNHGFSITFIFRGEKSPINFEGLKPAFVHGFWGPRE